MDPIGVLVTVLVCVLAILLAFAASREDTAQDFKNCFGFLPTRKHADKILFEKEKKLILNKLELIQRNIQVFLRDIEVGESKMFPQIRDGYNAACKNLERARVLARKFGYID